MKRSWILSIFMLFLVLLSCRQVKHTPASFVEVFAYDGSVQCETQETPPEAMAQKLTAAGVTVYCAMKSHDGLSRISLCGMPAGNINVFKISSDDLKQAVALGFKPVDTLPEYPGVPCR